MFSMNNSQWKVQACVIVKIEKTNRILHLFVNFILGAIMSVKCGQWQLFSIFILLERLPGIKMSECDLFTPQLALH